MAKAKAKSTAVEASCKKPRRYLTPSERAQAIELLPVLGPSETARRFGKSPQAMSKLCNSAHQSCAELRPKQMAEAHLKALDTAERIGAVQIALGMGVVRGLPFAGDTVTDDGVPDNIPGKHALVAQTASNILSQGAKTLGLIVDKSQSTVEVVAKVYVGQSPADLLPKKHADHSND